MRIYSKYMISSINLMRFGTSLSTAQEDLYGNTNITQGRSQSLQGQQNESARRTAVCAADQ